MTVAKALRTRSQQARAKAIATGDAPIRDYWLDLSKTWEAMSKIHEQGLSGEFDRIQIEAVRAKIEEERVRVREQMRVVDQLRQQGSMTPVARGLLDTLCESLDLHCACLEQLTREYRKNRRR